MIFEQKAACRSASAAQSLGPPASAVSTNPRTSRSRRRPLPRRSGGRSVGSAHSSRLRQIVDQRFRSFEVACVEPLGEPFVDRQEKLARFLASGVGLPRRARLVAARSSHDKAPCRRAPAGSEARRHSCSRRFLEEKEFAFDTKQFGDIPVFLVVLCVLVGHRQNLRPTHRRRRPSGLHYQPHPLGYRPRHRHVARLQGMRLKVERRFIVTRRSRLPASRSPGQGTKSSL
jgi:hypothetical protein